jgi:hypothetical protein
VHAAPAAHTSAAAPAAVGYGSQYFNGIGYFNAWSGGPYIKEYNSPAANNDFNVTSSDGTNFVIRLSNNGGENGYCIGDEFNQVGAAKAYLNPCGSGIPWGGYFTEQNCYPAPGFAFHNNHWNAWFSGGDSNGNQYYLNTGDRECFLQVPAY